MPTTTVLATSAAISESSLSAAWTEVTFTFTSGYNLTAGTQYALVVKPTTSGLRLRYNASGTYTGGQRYYSSSGSSWTSSSAYDYYFKEYGTITTSYVYDGDGNRVTQTVDGVTTVYPNQYYEKNLSTAVVTAHYYLGSKLVAVSLDGTLSYILQDHLGSTVSTVNSSGAVVNTLKFYAFGASRNTQSELNASTTRKLYTGQIQDNNLLGQELYYYGARYYDPQIGRFASPDSLIQIDSSSTDMQLTLAVSYSDPNILLKLNQAQRESKYSKDGIQDPQLLNRYSYARNNPLKYNDSSGHWIWIVAGAAVGALVGLGSYALTHQNNFQWGDAAKWAGGGTLIGVTLGLGTEWVAGSLVAREAISATIGTTSLAFQRFGLKAIQWANDTSRINHIMDMSKPGHDWSQIIKLTGDPTKDYAAVQKVATQVINSGSAISKMINGQMVYEFNYTINGVKVAVTGYEASSGVFEISNVFMR